MNSNSLNWFLGSFIHNFSSEDKSYWKGSFIFSEGKTQRIRLRKCLQRNEKAESKKKTQFSHNAQNRVNF